MKLVGVPKDAVCQVWPLAAPMLVPAIARSSGRFSLKTIYEECLSGDQQLWLVWDPDSRLPKATVVTQIIPYPTGLKVLDVVAVAGEDRKKWTALLSQLEAWASSKGCKLVQLVARRGWAKELSEYDMTHILLEKVLDG